MPSFIVNHTKNHKKSAKDKKDFIINNQAIKMKHVWNQELADVTTYFCELSQKRNDLCAFNKLKGVFESILALNLHIYLESLL